jgi:hypothetical protein
MMLPCSCLKNPFKLLELLFVTPWIVINNFCVKKLHWWEGNFGRCLMKIRILMVWTSHNNCKKWKFITIQGVKVCEKVWYKAVGLVWSTYMLFKRESPLRCRFLQHGNKGTKKQHCATRQVVSNVKALIRRCVDVMPHKMKGIGDGW